MRQTHPEDEAAAEVLCDKLAGMPRTYRVGLWLDKTRPPPTPRTLDHAVPRGRLPEEAWFGRMIAANPDALSGTEIAALAQIRARATTLEEDL